MGSSDEIRVNDAMGGASVANPTLQLGSKLRDETARLQLALRAAGSPVKTDGIFGCATRQAVATFQQKHGLEATGAVDEATWQALEHAVPSVEEDPLDSTQPMPGFRGDLAWLHGRRTHAGGPYWPGGAVGVHLDPGVDLGSASPEIVTAAYRGHLDNDAWRAVEGALGKRGEIAQECLRHDPVLRQINIDRPTAAGLFAHVADPIWRALVRHFPSLGRDDAPPEIQTAMLSLAFDYGPTHHTLEALRQQLAKRDWSALADLVNAMEKHHRLDRMHRRRRQEAALIRRAID